MAALVESASIGLLWVALDGEILWANAADIELLGYEYAEYIGHNIREFYENPQAAKFVLRSLANHETLRNCEVRLKCKDGSRRLVSLDTTAYWEEDQFVHGQCLTRDITDQRRAEELSNHFGAMVESSDDAIISKDLNGIITSWNSAAERIFGYTPAEAIGKSVTILIPKDRLGEEPGVIATIRAGGRVDHYETVRVRKDGSEVDISLTVSPIRTKSGEIVGASKIARDITTQKQHQIQVEGLVRELREANNNLEAKVAERTSSLNNLVEQMEEFSYTVSHDLRAPLRAMSLYAQVLLAESEGQTDSNRDSKTYLGRIASNCARLDRMILELLAFGRIANGGVELTKVSLDAVIADVIHHLPRLQSPNATIRVAPLGSVMGYEPSLMQALSNLLNNAVKFVAPGRLPVVHVDSETRGDRVRLFIQDNGIGVDPKYQHRLFSMFERIQPDLPYEGTGVGLAIVRKAVSRMGGTVGMESNGSNGSRFWIELNAAPRDEK